MLDRVHADVAAYAAKIGLSPSYATYCQIKMDMETNSQPKDGLVPFGSTYNTMKTWEELGGVLRAREQYERADEILYLARAKAALVAAANSNR